MGGRGRWNWYSFDCKPGLCFHGRRWEVRGWEAGWGRRYDLSLRNRRLRGNNNLNRGRQRKNTDEKRQKVNRERLMEKAVTGQ